MSPGRRTPRHSHKAGLARPPRLFLKGRVKSNAHDIWGCDFHIQLRACHTLNAECWALCRQPLFLSGLTRLLTPLFSFPLLLLLPGKYTVREDEEIIDEHFIVGLVNWPLKFILNTSLFFFWRRPP